MTESSTPESRYNDRLWEHIRIRVRNAGLEIVTFEELGPILEDRKTHIDQVMAQRGYPVFKTNMGLDAFVEDQLFGCRKIKAEYGTDVCISEVAMTKHIEPLRDNVGIYAKE